MLTLAHHYEVPLTTAAGTFSARVYGQRMDDGRWSGSLVFVPDGGGRLIATERETTQSSLAELTYWASGLSEVYLQGALARGLALQPEAQLARELARLERIEAWAEIRADALIAPLQWLGRSRVWPRLHASAPKNDCSRRSPRMLQSKRTRTSRRPLNRGPLRWPRGERCGQRNRRRPRTKGHRNRKRRDRTSSANPGTLAASVSAVQQVASRPQ